LCRCSVVAVFHSVTAIHAVVMIAYVRNFELPTIEVVKDKVRRQKRRMLRHMDGALSPGSEGGLDSETDSDDEKEKGAVALIQKKVRGRYNQIKGRVEVMGNRIKGGVGARFRWPGRGKTARGGNGNANGNGSGSRAAGRDGVSPVDVSAAVAGSSSPGSDGRKTWLGGVGQLFKKKPKTKGDKFKIRSGDSDSDSDDEARDHFDDFDLWTSFRGDKKDKLILEKTKKSKSVKKTKGDERRKLDESSLSRKNPDALPDVTVGLCALNQVDP
jgi:hypothetical protein